MKIVLGIKMYELKETAELLSVTKTSIRNYLKRGLIIGAKLGGRWYISEENLKAFVNGNTNVKSKE